MEGKEDMDDEFVIKACSITKNKCKGGCDTCRIADKERKKNIEDAKDKYRFNGKTAAGGYSSNDLYTVLKIKPENLEDIKKVFGYRMTKSFFPNELMLNVKDYYFMYPEWMTTMKVLDMKEPKTYLYEENKPLIACYEDFFYVTMPIFMKCGHEQED